LKTIDPAVPAALPFRVLIVGAGGLLGAALQAALAADFDVTALTRAQLDLLDPMAVALTLERLRPTVVVNASAWSDVDAAEDHAAAADAINHLAVAALVSACARAACSLVHFSSDFVFDGRKRSPYVEEDAAQPLGVYGLSKLAGEQAVLASGGPHLVLRLSWLYGAGGRNFFSSVREWLQQDRELRVVADQVSVPNPVQLVAAALRHVLTQARAQGPHYLAERRGLYHLSASGQASRYEFAQAVQAALGGLAKARLLPAKAADFGLKAQRPAYSALGSARFESRFGIVLPSWLAALHGALPCP
jgi:dTDP-4-dehydrorhamnose reductase